LRGGERGNMTAKVIAFFARRITDPYLLSGLLSVIPVTELKGSILYAASSGANVWLCALSAYLASLAVVAFQVTVFFPIFLKLRGKRRVMLFTERIAERADKILRRAKDADDRNERLFLGVYTFVALPLPMTGIWAGAILAALLGLDKKHSFFALAAGNFTAGGIVLAVALVAGERANLVLDVFFALAILLLLFYLFRAVLQKRRERGGSRRA